MKKKLILLLIIISLIFQFTGCATLNDQVAYTVYPIGYIIERITGSSNNAVSIQDDEIIQRAKIKDDYEDILKASDALFQIGQVEPYLSIYRPYIVDMIAERIYLSSVNAIYLFKRYTPVVTNNEVTYVESDYYDASLFEDVDVNAKDLYLWLDPIAMLSMAKDIRDWYIQKYPDNAKFYEDNCDKLENDLVQLDASYQALATKNLNENKSIKFVSMTSSFGNWQKTYGIQVYPVILSKYGALPNNEQLECIKQRIIADSVQYIVYEPNMSDDMVELFNQLQEELNLTRVELSNLSSLTDSQKGSGKDYISIMYENLQTLESMAISNEVNNAIHDVLD
ncbi:MAG: zinc ABC transporter substrate-binding protein [Erysipelotrichaceae bacterium]|nr:zinc ABC transporter substrate-binding protein [Erysipelotrichaceae bacterium]